MATPPAAHEEEEEEALELPPLDGDSGEGHDPRFEQEDDLAEGEPLAGDDAAPLDLDAGALLDAVEERGADDTEAARDAVDVGVFADAVALPDDERAASDEQGLARDEDEASPFDVASNGDTGAGTGEDPSSFVDEGALPPLDADDPGHADHRDHSAPVPATSAGELTILSAPWQKGRWRVADGMGARVPCWLVAASAAYVVAAGPTVLVARGGARVSRGEGLDIDAAAVAASDDVVLAVARRGALFASLDGGATWAAGGATWPAFRGPLEVAATPGRFWICENGALWAVRWGESGRAEPPLLVRRGGVRAMAASESVLVLLTEQGDSLALERLRGDDEAAHIEAVPAETAALLGEDPPALAAAASGRLVAILASGAAHLTSDAGRSFHASPAASAVGVAFAGAGEHARPMLLCATPERGRDAKLFLAEGTSAGAFVRVAELPAAPGRAALAWDAAREVIWVACSAGLVAFERTAKH